MRSAEFQLAIEGCRAAFGDADISRIRQVGEAVDWPRFLRVVRFHRVQGLVRNSITASDLEPPREIAEAIAADATAIAAANLRCGTECGHLKGRFDAHGIDCLFLKGLTLGVLAYDTPWIKAAVDIDLLVAPEQLTGAAALLAERGYGLSLPDTGLGRLATWHRRHKESVWTHSSGGLQIDLHTRLADNPRLIPAIGLGSPRQQVQVTERITLPTLATDDLFSYLAVHGASSAWFRLKWITDLAALLHGRPADEISHLHRRSQEFGAGRAAAQALLLADTLYQTLSSVPELKAELERDPVNRWLCRKALQQLAGRDDPTEPTATFGGTVIIHYTQPMLLPGFAFKLSELLRQARSAVG